MEVNIFIPGNVEDDAYAPFFPRIPGAVPDDSRKEHDMEDKMIFVDIAEQERRVVADVAEYFSIGEDDPFREPAPATPTEDGYTYRPLMEHQQDALEYCLSRQNIALLMEMRLGKTLVAIRWAKELEKRGEPMGNVLVVAPVTVLRSWRNELVLEDEHAVMVNGLNAAKRRQAFLDAFNIEHRTWVLANYELLLSDDYLLTAPFDLVILDESTRIKNPKAKTTMRVTKAWRTVPHRAILTGMAAPESELDFFCQFKFLHGSFMGCHSFWEYRAKFFQESDDYWKRGWVPRENSSTVIKRTVHMKAFVRRRTELNIGSRKIFSTRYVDMSPEQHRFHKDIFKRYEFDTKEGDKKETDYAIVRGTWLARVAGGFTPDGQQIGEGKQKELLSLLHGELSGQGVVVWFRFNDELFAVRDILEKEYFGKVGVITGDTPTEQREIARKMFNEGTGTRVLLCQVMCAKYGIDCSGADTAVYYSNAYSCEARIQSEDRIVHPMKKRPLLYIDLVANGSLDEDVVPKLQDKTYNARWLMSRLDDLWEEFRRGFVAKKN